MFSAKTEKEKQRSVCWWLPYMLNGDMFIFSASYGILCVFSFLLKKEKWNWKLPCCCKLTFLLLFSRIPIILADIMLFGIACFCQDLQILILAIIHLWWLIENMSAMAWVNASFRANSLGELTWQSWDAQKDISIVGAYIIIFE